MDVVSFVCRVHFSTVLLKIDKLVMRDHSFSRLVLTTLLNEHLLAQIHRFIEDRDISLANEVVAFVAENVH